MTSQLSLYNDALLLCKERFLASLSENREPRYLLDQVWDRGGVRACLEMGQWYFAMRTIQSDYDTTMQPGFGFRRAFSKPTDWVVTCALCSDEFFRVPLLQYVDESSYWYCELDTIYVKYVSSDATYGENLSTWPDAFRAVVAAYFASQIVGKMSSSSDLKADIDKTLKHAKLMAKSNSAMAEPTKFPAQGNWSNSRTRWGNRRRDGGNTSGDLIG